MFEHNENCNEENLWIGVIKNAWITTLKDKAGDSKRRESYKTLLDQEKHIALSFFRDKDGMLSWICEQTNLDYNYITELFEKSLVDENIKQLIINNYNKTTIM